MMIMTHTYIQCIRIYFQKYCTVCLWRFPNVSDKSMLWSFTLLFPTPQAHLLTEPSKPIKVRLMIYDWNCVAYDGVFLSEKTTGQLKEACTPVQQQQTTQRERFLKQTSLVVMASSPDDRHSCVTAVGRHGNVQDFPVSSGRIELLNGVKKSVSIIPGIIIKHRSISILFEIVHYR